MRKYFLTSFIAAAKKTFAIFQSLRYFSSQSVPGVGWKQLDNQVEKRSNENPLTW